MKPKENIIWTIVVILAAAAICSFYFVDKFKIANSQFHRDNIHTYSERICTGSSGSGSRVCTNYFFTEEQYSLNNKLDQIYKVLIILALAVLSLEKILTPAPKDKMSQDPVGTMKTGWTELMRQNEEQKKDPKQGFRMTPEIKTLIKIFLWVLLISLCLGLINVYFENSGIYQRIFKIN